MATNETGERVEDLTPAEAAARARVSERTISRWIASGKLPARKIQSARNPNGRVLIRAADVDRVTASELVEIAATEPAAG